MEARAGTRAAAEAASSASATVLHPASTTAATVSSQVASRGSRREASGLAARAASRGISNGRYTNSRIWLPPVLTGTLAAGQQPTQQPRVPAGQAGNEPGQHGPVVHAGIQCPAHLAGR